jgi:hypothetical protein
MKAKANFLPQAENLEGRLQSNRLKNFIFSPFLTPTNDVAPGLAVAFVFSPAEPARQSKQHQLLGVR